MKNDKVSLNDLVNAIKKNKDNGKISCCEDGIAKPELTAFFNVHIATLLGWMEELKLYRELDAISSEMCHKGIGSLDNSEEIKRCDELRERIRKLQTKENNEFYPFYEPFV